MSWNYRIVIVVPAASKSVAEEAARSINSTGPAYDGDAFSMMLSANGAEPATHYGLYTSATDEMIAAMSAALPQIFGVMFWRHGVAGELQASNVTDPTGQAWGLDASLTAAGLREVVQPSPYG